MDQAHQVLAVFLDLCFHHQLVADGVTDTRVAAQAGSSCDCGQRGAGDPEPGCAGVAESFPHAGHPLLDSFLAQTTNSMVMVNTAIVCWMLVLFFANRVRTDVVDRPMVSAIRYSIVIFLAGNAIGGYMLARGSHTVGTADGGPGLPFVNWSVIGGDLRIAHFIAIHAIQIVPLFAYILSQMAPIPAIRQRKLAVAALTVIVGGTVGATFIQAAMGRPLIPWLH